MCVINYTRTYYHENMIVVNITVNAIYGIILEIIAVYGIVL